MSDEATAIESDLVDLDGLSLADLAALEEFDDDVLAHALRRILADVDGPEDPIAAFQAFI